MCSSFTSLLTELHIGNLACQLVQVVLCVIQEAVDDLIALTGTLRALLLGQQLLIGLPVMRLRSAMFVCTGVGRLKLNQGRPLPRVGTGTNNLDTKATWAT